MATFRLRRANLIPMQFLGPAPKGRYVYGSMVSLFSLLNLDNDVLGEKKMKTRNQKSLYLLIQRSLAEALQKLAHFYGKCLSN